MNDNVLENTVVTGCSKGGSWASIAWELDGNKNSQVPKSKTRGSTPRNVFSQALQMILVFWSRSWETLSVKSQT